MSSSPDLLIHSRTENGLVNTLSWLLIPLGAGIGASVWGWYAGRPRRADLWTDLDRYDRLRAALSRAAS